MNFLAHIYLSCNDDHLLIGNFLTDFLNNKELKLLDDSLKKGVELHRKIDTYTDKHPAVRECVAIARKDQGKYAPVVVDIFFDYLLAKHWSKFEEVELPIFTKTAYHILLSNIELVPEKLQQRIKNMIKADWLMSYSRWDGMEFTFKKVKQRSKYASNLQNAVIHLKKDEMLYDRLFLNFMPDVKNFVEIECAC